MGCINIIRIRDKKKIIKSNQMIKNEEKKKPSHAMSEKLYIKKFFEDPVTTVAQNVESMIENNPLPFVKIKIKKHHL